MDFTIWDVILVLSIRFFAFDFYLFRFIREPLMKSEGLFGWFFNKLFKCPFCQGFWSGFLFALLDHSFYTSFKFGFMTAIISFTWYVCTFKLLVEMENMKSK